MNRAIVIVMDGCGAGVAPDAAEFGDIDNPSTLKNVWDQNPGLKLPNLRDCGLLKAAKIAANPRSEWLFDRLGFQYGRLQELSKGGKDSVTGHWEMAGIVTKSRFPTYPNGFPVEVIQAFEAHIGVKVLGNEAASGTEIINRLGPEHLRTKCPIVYTSADSVFQVAAHEDLIGLERLYEICQIARDLLIAPDNVQRVIARPFKGSEPDGFNRTDARRDFPLTPPANLCDAVGDVFGIGVVSELFAHRGFRGTRRTQSNHEHAQMIQEAMASDARWIWANFEDFDMKFGHRNDPKGFGGCLEEFDLFLGSFLPTLTPQDVLILTADHGNDPTTTSTDHSREYVPCVVIGESLSTSWFGDLKGMNAVGATVARHIGVPSPSGRCLI